MSNILEVKGLDKSFGGNRVTQDVTLTLGEGTKEAIIGPNGAGKSTFFNLLTGYHRPDKGTITFDGVDITGWPPHRISRAGQPVMSMREGYAAFVGKLKEHPRPDE